MKKDITTMMNHINLIVEEYAIEILKYTPQLYLKEHGKLEFPKIEAIASAILIECDNQHFLITAGHVIEENNPEDIGIMIGDEFNILNGEIKYARPSKDSVSNKIDVAIWKLNLEIVETLKSYFKFLLIDKFGVNHILQQVDPRYLVVGFPWQKSKLKFMEKKIKVEPFIFLTKNADKEAYKELKVEEFSHIVLEYLQRKIKSSKTGVTVRGIPPEGISGCGVWYITNFSYLPNQVPELKLLSVVTYQDKKKRFIQTTRIDIIIEGLRRDFNLNINPSRTVRLN